MHGYRLKYLDYYTVAQHTTDIARIESLLEDCESTDEESSFSGESVNPEPGAEDLPAAILQGQEEEEPHNIKMKDVKYDPNPPPPFERGDDLLPVSVQAAQSDPPPEDNEGRGDLRDNRDVIVEDERIASRLEVLLQSHRRKTNSWMTRLVLELRLPLEG